MASNASALSARSFVVEVGSNDGYLLQHFVAQGIPVLGIDPAAQRRRGGARSETCPDAGAVLRRGDVAARARRRRAPRRPDRRQQRAGAGRRTCTTSSPASPLLLQPRGVATVELPHLLRLMEENQFDTIYHEHFSYFSLPDGAAASSRITACAASTSRSCRPTAARCASTSATTSDATHADATRASPRSSAASAPPASTAWNATPASRERVQETKRAILDFLIDAKRRGKHGRRLRRAGQGQHAAQLLRRAAPTSSTTRSTAIRTSRASSSRARASRSMHPRAHRGDEAGLPLHPAVEPARTRSSSRCAASATGAAGS